MTYPLAQRDRFDNDPSPKCMRCGDEGCAYCRELDTQTALTCSLCGCFLWETPEGLLVCECGTCCAAPIEPEPLTDDSEELP